jgi:hypothetical protein
MRNVYIYSDVRSLFSSLQILSIERMSVAGRSHYGKPIRPQARPFDEFMIGYPVGNAGNGIHSSGNSSNDSPQQSPAYGIQPNFSLPTQQQIMLQTTHILHTHVPVK